MVCGGVLFGRYAASRVRAAPPGELAASAAGSTTPAPAPTLSTPASLRPPSAWLVVALIGLSEKDTLRTWTVLVTILGGVGFAVVAILSLFVK